MNVALTGATGFIGSHVLTELHEHGHEVTALVRNGTQADLVKARGATPTVIDLHDRAAVASKASALSESRVCSFMFGPPRWGGVQRRREHAGRSGVVRL